jgi:tetratricopeptide (TPR) repeat protein
MQTAANNNLVLTDSSSFGLFADSQAAISIGEFYQRIASHLIRCVHKDQFLRELGDRLVVAAEHSHAFRQIEMLEQVSEALVSLPLPREYEAVGRYYQALCVQRFGHGNVGQAARLLEHVAENAPTRYRLRALVSLGANSTHKGDYQSALSFYYDAGRFASRQRLYDPHALLVSPKDVAVVTSLEGNHRHAVALLENLFPLAHAMRLAQPHAYYDYMNSLAVELCVVGRLEAARNASEIVLASPFARAYPEWRETYNEITLKSRRASRDIVAVHRRIVEYRNQRVCEPQNLVRLPVRQSGDSATATEPVSGESKQPARLLSFLEWAKKMNNKPEHTSGNKKSFKDMDGREMLLKIMELTADDTITDDELRRIVESIERILSERKGDGK